MEDGGWRVEGRRLRVKRTRFLESMIDSRTKLMFSSQASMPTGVVRNKSCKIAETAKCPQVWELPRAYGRFPRISHTRGGREAPARMGVSPARMNVLAALPRWRVGLVWRECILRNL